MVSLILGIIGSIIGMICSIIALFVGGVGQAFNADGASTIAGLGWGAFLLSIVALVGSILVKSKPKAGGIMMIICGIGGIICISMFYILPGVLLIIPGAISLFSKKKNAPITPNA